MTRLKADVTPAVLEWARLSSGMSPEDVARKISRATAPEKILAWESGDDQPSIPQLRKLADAYKRPLSLFFLPEPPTAFQPMHDFRRMPGEIANVYSRGLMLELRAASERRELALELMADLEVTPLRFDLGTSLDESPEVVGANIRDALSVSIADQTLSRNRSNSFTFWRKRIEATGVLVFQADRVQTSEMLGFSIASEILPVIGVNRRNKRGRVFSSLHEFTHLMLRRSSICDMDEDAGRPPEEQRVEVFCNAVAGAALLPREDLVTEVVVNSKGPGRHDYSIAELDALANKYGVSALVVMRRLLTLNKTTRAYYEEKQRVYRAIYSRLEAESRDSLPDDLARNIPLETVGKLGTDFVRLVLENYYSDRITLSEVSDYLGVKVRHVPKIEQQIRAG